MIPSIGLCGPLIQLASWVVSPTQPIASLRADSLNVFGWPQAENVELSAGVLRPAVSVLFSKQLDDPDPS